MPGRPFAKSVFALGLSLVGFGATPGQAAIVYWDGDGAGTVDGGAGTWDTTLSRWSTDPSGSTYQPWVNANNDDAVLGGPSGAKPIALGTAITANSITIATRDYTITSGVAANSLGSTSGTLTIDAQFSSGTAILNVFYEPTLSTIVKNGSGFVSTGVSQTAFKGKWQVNGGILSLPGDLRLGIVPTETVPDQVTLNGGFLRTSTATVTFNVNRGITLGVAGGGFDSANTGSLTWAGPITGSLGGTLTKRDTATLILTNDSNNYDGITIVNGGRLVVGTANALGASTAGTQVGVGAGVIFDGAATNFTTNEPFMIAGLGLDGGAITIRNGATPTLNGEITLTGDAAISVDATSTVTFSNANAFTSAGVALTLQGEAGTGGGGIISGAINLAFGSLNKSGTGKWVLAGANIYDGATNILAGTLVVNGSITGTLDVSVGGTLAGNGTISTANGGNMTLLSGGKISPGDGGAGLLKAVLGGGGSFSFREEIQLPNSQSLLFEIGAPASNDILTVTGGAVNIGFSLLEFDDFSFTTLPTFSGGGTFTLFSTDTPIVGRLGANVTGMIGGLFSQLQFADDNTDLVVVVIPEPASVALLLGGVGLLGVRRRRGSSRLWN